MVERFSRVDGDGRITIPPKLAKELYGKELKLFGGLVIGKDKTYEALIVTEKDKPVVDDKDWTYLFKVSMTDDCKLDKKRRINLSGNLGEYARIRIGGKVAIVGEPGSALVICEENRWKKYRNESRKELSYKALLTI
ncbi:MAG: hypothetical protein KAT94_02735 [Candidatus Aenigmarchaeota archaeon]|nr:hypothetical protein [Candidatus Aenigmarchaeota archaeon]MCK4531757.1 hypothetical protein [Candidatus Aenigmarchaeota archaeon]